MSENVSDHPRWVVLKFGGTSVASVPRWKTIAALAQARVDEGLLPVVVCSALSGVSNLLETLIDGVADAAETRRTLDRLRERHDTLARELGLEPDPAIVEILHELDSMCTGARLLGEAPPRFRARVMSAGELMSTRIGAAFLAASGLRTRWVDSRECLVARAAAPGTPDGARFLSAECDYAYDEELSGRLADTAADVLVMQGFIASDPDGHTVLLGRGGSDTSAAYVAGMLGAERLEIWTDVPGIFTTNPRTSGEARLLLKVGYNEALTMASLGAKVLHPRSIEPAREAGIPLHLRSTPMPSVPGTVVADDRRVPRAVKAVTSRKGLSLLSVARPAQWQQVGLLADITSAFKDAGLSIDLICSSAAKTHVTIDPAAAPLSDGRIDHVQAALDQFGDVVRRDGVGTVSIVGSGVVAMLHELGPALASVGESEILFVVHAADGSHVTFVLPDEQVGPFAERVHAGVFVGADRSDLGSDWDALVDVGEARRTETPAA